MSDVTAPVIQILREPWADPDIALPAYETAGAAGADLRANFPTDARNGVALEPGQRALIPTGLRVAIPPGYEVQIRARSGLALKFGVAPLNSPGTVDSDYRGPIGVILINAGQERFPVAHGDRIAQMVVAPVARAAFGQVSALDDTERGSGGFGSTGRR